MRVCVRVGSSKNKFSTYKKTEFINTHEIRNLFHPPDPSPPLTPQDNTNVVEMLQMYQNAKGIYQRASTYLPPSLPTYVFIYLLIILSISRSLSVCLSLSLSVCLSVCLPACLRVCLSVCLSLSLSIYLYLFTYLMLSYFTLSYLILSYLIYPSYLSTYLFTYLPIYPSTYLYIQWVYLSNLTLSNPI